MSSRPDGRGASRREETREPPTPVLQASRAESDREALENLAEVLAIPRELDEAERRETRDDDANADAAGA